MIEFERVAKVYEGQRAALSDVNPVTSAVLPAHMAELVVTEATLIGGIAELFP